MVMDFNIALDDLKGAAAEYNWHVTQEFFESFGNTQIISADVEAAVKAWKASGDIFIDCSLQGSVTVPCDRCLEDLEIPVDTEASLKLTFSEADVDEEDGREIIEASDDKMFDMAQTIYDYVCLAIPLQHCHEEGACSPEAMKYLSQDTSGEEKNAFAALENLFK